MVFEKTGIGAGICLAIMWALVATADVTADVAVTGIRAAEPSGSSVFLPLVARPGVVRPEIDAPDPEAAWIESLFTAACQSPSRRVRRMETILEQGGRVDWSAANNRIAFDRLGEDGYYDLYTMEPDGSDQTCLTCGQGAPSRHAGNPAWHPAGELIVFQAEKQSHFGLSYGSMPGFGAYNDLWLAHRDGERFYRLTDLPNSEDSGVLHPHFSQDGGMLSWSEMVEKPSLATAGKEFGYWKLMVADFHISAEGPVLSNMREFEPGGSAFYENHGFSPDGSRLLFSSSFGSEGSVYASNDIYTLDLATTEVTRLTEAYYNEHAHFRPDGSSIVWMTNTHNWFGGTDYWLMDADGGRKKRLTYFNWSGCPEYMGTKVTAADSSWNSDGSRMAAYLQTDLVQQAGKIVVIDLDR
jgi:Tol biopolymer transport system component